MFWFCFNESLSLTLTALVAVLVIIERVLFDHYHYRPYHHGRRHLRGRLGQVHRVCSAVNL